MAHIESYVQVPPDSTGKKIKHADNAGILTPMVTVIDVDNTNNNWQIDAKGQAYMRFAEGEQTIDAFGRSLSSTTQLIGRYIPSYDILSDQFVTEVSGAGSDIELSSAGSEIIYTTDTGPNDFVIRTTEHHHRFIPGNGNIAGMLVRIGDTGKNNVTRRWGYFDEYNGFFFELENSDFYVVTRNSAVDTRIAASAFNGDTLDGNGLSEFNLDLSKPQLFQINIQSNYGPVRFILQDPTKGRIIITTTSNINTITTPLAGSLILPMRFEQFNTNVPASISQMTVGFVGVATEGVISELQGSTFTLEGTSGTSIPSGGSEIPLGSLRMSETIGSLPNRKILLPKLIEVYNGGLDPILLKAYKNATPIGADWLFPVPTDSVAEIDLSAQSISGGKTVNSWIIGPQERRILDISKIFYWPLGEYVQLKHYVTDGSDVFTLTGAMMSGIATQGQNANAATAPVWVVSTWREVL